MLEDFLFSRYNQFCKTDLQNKFKNNLRKILHKKEVICYKQVVRIKLQVVSCFK